MTRDISLFGILPLVLAAVLLHPVSAHGAEDPGAAPASHTTRVSRIAGDSRVATAVAASRHAFPDGADTVVIAAARRFPDALAAVPLAARERAPLLLVEERASGAVLEEIERLGARRAVLVAASGAVPVVVELELARAGLEVERVAGDGRFHTAAWIARRLGPGEAGDAIVASGDTFADALPAGPLAARAGVPILLSAQAVLPPDPAAVIQELGIRRTLVVGGAAAIDEAVSDALPRPRRLAGADRYETSVLVAGELLARGGSLDVVAVATGRDFADALAAGPVMAVEGGPLLLVDGQDPDMAPAVYRFLTEHRDRIGEVLLFGGEAAVTDAVRERILEAVRRPS